MQRGAPDHLRSDNGPEFIAEPLQTWLKRVGIEPIRILPFVRELIPRINSRSFSNLGRMGITNASMARSARRC